MASKRRRKAEIKERKETIGIVDIAKQRYEELNERKLKLIEAKRKSRDKKQSSAIKSQNSIILSHLKQITEVDNYMDRACKLYIRERICMNRT